MRCLWFLNEWYSRIIKAKAIATNIYSKWLEKYNNLFQHWALPVHPQFHSYSDKLNGIFLCSLRCSGTVKLHSILGKKRSYFPGRVRSADQVTCAAMQPPRVSRVYWSSDSTPSVRVCMPRLFPREKMVLINILDLLACSPRRNDWSIFILEKRKAVQVAQRWITGSGIIHSNRAPCFLNNP